MQTVKVIYEKWRAIDALCNGPKAKGWSDKDAAPYLAKAIRLEDRVAATPCVTKDDLIAKLSLLETLTRQDHPAPEELEYPMVKLLLSAIADAKRLLAD